ncbi:MAG: hypothetical protein WCA37_11115 [Terracidiphilus sp.]
MPGDRAARRMDAPALLRLWHLTSLDAPSVAVAWALAFAWAGGLVLPGWVPVMLALGTWAVYIGDRLLDARAALANGAEHRLRERHFFHWRHRRVMAPLAGLAGAAAAGMIVGLMPMAIRERNAVLGAAALAYFSGVHAPGLRWLRLLPKELLVGALFTAGCALPTLTRMRLAHVPMAAMGALLLVAGLYAALAWLNCHAIERWESRSVQRGQGVVMAGWALASVGLAAAAVMRVAEPRLAELMACAAGSGLLLCGLDRVRMRLSPVALRAAADLVLLTPLVCLLR